MRESVVGRLSAVHEDTQFKYTCCAQNGCWDASCIVKCEVKDGKLISISADDSINENDPREDIERKVFAREWCRCGRAPWGMPGKGSSMRRRACSIRSSA